MLRRDDLRLRCLKPPGPHRLRRFGQLLSTAAEPNARCIAPLLARLRRVHRFYCRSRSDNGIAACRVAKPSVLGARQGHQRDNPEPDENNGITDEEGAGYPSREVEFGLGVMEKPLYQTTNPHSGR